MNYFGQATATPTVTPAVAVAPVCQKCALPSWLMLVVGIVGYEVGRAIITKSGFIEYLNKKLHA